ncbi:MAG: glycosyltransferase family 2 protein [Candidatus Acidiferrales bacterium]
MTRPLISVLIDTYNHEKYIEQAVVSAIEQDFSATDYEIVVVDDGSTDRTPEIVRKFAPRVRLLTKTNGGQASAFNAAFPELYGGIVAFLDGDDWFAAGKLRAVMDAFARNGDAVAIGHGYYEFHEDTGETILCAPEKPRFFSLATPELARQVASLWQFLWIGALTVRRNVLEHVVPVSEALVFCADAPIAWAAMAMGTLVIEQPLSYYRQHMTNLHAVRPDNQTRMQQRADMNERMFAAIEPMLVRLGVSHDALAASFYPEWAQVSRWRLKTFGGSRHETVLTETRAFRSQYRSPTFGYQLFKYVTVGTAARLLSPKQFYALWEWYGRRTVGHFPEPFRNRG